VSASLYLQDCLLVENFRFAVWYIVSQTRVFMECYLSSTKDTWDCICQSELLHYLKAKINFKNILCNVHRLQIYCKIPVKFSELKRYAFLLGKLILIYLWTV
jgi:hypothetical protein